MFKVNHTKEHKKQQHCPLCNSYVKHSDAFPNYVCNRCAKQAMDISGKPIEFVNITEAGTGIQGKYIEIGKLYRSPICFIKGIKCKAVEAEQGLIVICPVEPSKRKRKAKAAEGNLDEQQISSIISL